MDTAPKRYTVRRPKRSERWPVNGTENTPISDPRVTPHVSRLLSALSPITVTKNARPSVWNM